MVNFAGLISKVSEKSVDDSGLGKAEIESIPYACHYAPDALLTKNGELLQIIEVPDFCSKQEFRKELRATIAEKLKGGDFSLSIHNVRVKEDSTIPWREDGKHGFSYKLHRKWIVQENAHLKYQNRVYITIIARGFKSKNNLLNLPLKFVFAAVKKQHAKFLQGKYEELSAVTDAVVSTLKVFHAKKLGVVDGVRSELITVLRRLTTLLLDRNPMYLEERDLSRQLLDDVKMVFGFNACEVWCGKRKKIAAVIGVKGCNGIDPQLLSMKLYMDVEFIIAERVNFDPNPSKLKNASYQRYLLGIAGQDKLKQTTKLDVFEKQKHLCVNHGVDVVLIADSADELKKSIVELVEAFSECGIAFFRHDLSLENALLSILPANFSFHTLSNFGIVDGIGEFALLGGLISGNRHCSRWGFAITLFWSVRNTPYFFNFHGDNGCAHTLFIGRNNTGKTILQNFIISEACKIGIRTFIVDSSKKSCVFINALNGEYRYIDKHLIHGIGFNPFSLEGGAPRAKYLMCYLLSCLGLGADKKIITKACDDIFALPVKERNEEKIREILQNTGYDVSKLFVKDGVIPLLLGVNERDASIWSQESLGFNLPNRWSEDVSILMLMLILYKIESQLNGSPSVIVLEESWNMSRVFSHDFLLSDFLKRMSKLNCVVLFTGSEIETMLSNQFTHDLQKEISTKIFLPGYVMGKQHSSVFNLTNKDVLMINGLQGYNRNFFVKQDNTSVVLKLNMSNMIECKVLSGTLKGIEYMKESIAQSASRNSNDWLPIFYNKFSE